MPNSLKCRLKKLAYQGLLSEKDLSRIYTDNDVVEELEKIKAEICQRCNDALFGSVSGIVDKHISELK